MLNKQGIFSRTSQRANAQAANSTASTSPLVTPLTAQNKSPEQSIMPGHLAALASATSKSLIPPEAIPSEVAPISMPDVKTASGSRLIVGPDVKLKGAEILDCDTLVVEGRVEATMDSRVIHIAEKGAYSGKVGIDVAEIYGNFEGELTARTKLIIYATGKVSGKIRYGKIYIEEGGELSGDIAAIKLETAKSNNANLQLAKAAVS